MLVPLTPVRFLYRAVDLYGRKTGIVSGTRRFTYAEFGERCERLAAGLLSQGVRAGDRIAYLSFNTHQLLEGYFGVPLARAIAMPLNVRLTSAELTAILNHSGTRMLLFEDEFRPLVEHFRTACPALSRYIGLDGGGSADLAYDDLLARDRAARPDVMEFDEAAPAELFYTSGSTGSPKGVLLSHRTLYLHAVSVLAAEPRHDDTGVELHTIPLFHANAWGRPHMATMMGMKQVMVRRFDPAAVLRMIEAERATAMSLVPTMAAALLQAAGLGTHDLSSMKEIFIGGAASSPELIARMENAFGCAVMASYGLTETAPVATNARPKDTAPYADAADGARRQAMAGWPQPGVEIRVADSEGNNVPRDMRTVGEVLVRGDGVMDGYFNDPEATAAVLSAAGWLHTGDMAVWDEESYIQIVDRKKDIIISGGENISSVEVEHAISAHPAVLECAVVSAPDSRWGEIPAAFVVLKPGQHLTKADLLDFLAERIARFKIPREVQFLEMPLPKTGSGKIFKRQLREQFWKSMARRVQG